MADVNPFDVSSNQTISQVTGAPDTTSTDNQVKPKVTAQPAVQVSSKNLSKAQVKQIILNAPKGTKPADIINGLIQRGYTLEGFKSAANPFNSSTGQTSATSATGTSTDSSTSATSTDTSTQPKSVGGFIGNIFKGGVDLVKNLYNVVANPAKTASSIVSLGEGIGKDYLNKTFGTKFNDKDTATFNSLVDSYVQKYGGWDKFTNSLYNDPVGVALDASIVLDGGESAIGKLSDLADAAGMSQTADVLSKASDAVKALKEAPGNLASKVTAPIAGKVSDLGSSVLGGLTGAGKESIETAKTSVAAGGSTLKSFTDALRGNVTPEKIVETAQNAFQSIKDARSADYTKALSKLKDSDQLLDLNSVSSTMSSQLEKFGIKVADDGKSLDFSRSTISTPDEQKIIQGVYDDVNSWGSKTGDLTPTSVDTLKRRLDNLYSPNKDASAFVTAVKGQVKNVLNTVPGYEKMTAAYQKASDVLDDLKGLSLGKNTANYETIFKKLTSALKDNQDYRSSLLDSLGDESKNMDLKAQIAGYNLSPYLARGLTGRFVEGLGLGVGAFKALANPSILIPMAATSPRVVGEFLRAMGMKAGDISKFKLLLKAVPQGARAIGAVNDAGSQGADQQSTALQQ